MRSNKEIDRGEEIAPVTSAAIAAYIQAPDNAQIYGVTTECALELLVPRRKE